MASKRNVGLGTMLGFMLAVGGVYGVTPAGTNDLGEIVVTATRSPVPRADIPASVSVVSGEQIQGSAARNLDDVLRSLDGLTILQSVGMGYGLPSQINIRGVPGQHGVLMLVDGMPLNESRGGFVNINEVPLSAIQQVEVVRGAFSSLYGTDAFSGVVNILTRDPGTGPHAEASGGLGNEGYYQAGIRGSAGDKAMGCTVTVEKRGIDNYLAHDHVIERAWDPAAMRMVEISRPAENYDYADERVLGKFTMELGKDAALAVHARYFDAELGYGQKNLAPVYPTPEDDVIESHTALLGASLNGKAAGGCDWSFQGYHRWQERDVFGLDLSHYAGVMPVYVRSESQTEGSDWKVDGAVSRRFADSHKVMLGGDFFASRADFSAARNRESGQPLPLSGGKTVNVNNTGMYIQDEADVAAKWKAVAGVRVDANSEFDPALSPRVGMQHEFADGTVGRASVGRAYRAPTVVELYQPAIAFGNTMFQSNPELDPEYITTVDLGVERRFGKTVRAHIEAFYNDMKDLIDTAVVGSGLTYLNTDQAWSAGGNAGLEWEFQPGLSLFANGTYQQTEAEDTGLNLALMPEYAGNAGVRVNHEVGGTMWQGSIAENYVGDRGYPDMATGSWTELDPYWRTDVSAKVGVGANFWIGCSVLNAFAERYQEWQLINPAPGRLYSVEAGIRYW